MRSPLICDRSSASHVAGGPESERQSFSLRNPVSESVRYMDFCALCLESKPLQVSHILPSFIYKWLKESSGGGYLRFGKNIDRRVQDGFKIPLLCIDCERHFNKWETNFARDMFHPYNSGSKSKFVYQDWLSHFCVSVSWRVAMYYFKVDQFEKVGAGFESDIDSALAVWKDFLFKSRKTPGVYEQHLLPVDEIDEIGSRLNPPRNINRYLMRAVEIDIISGEDTLMTFAKMGRFILFGYIKPPVEKWHGTRVAVNHGVVEPKKYVLPYSLMEFLFDRAINMERLAGSMSKRQQAIVGEHMRKNIDRFGASDQMRAIKADYRIFGEVALPKKDKS